VKFILDNWLLLAIALSSGALLLWPVIQGATGVGLSAAEVVQSMNRDKALVIDVCEPEEFAQGHVLNAINVPLAQLQDRLPAVAKNKTQPVVFVCAAGKRSQMALLQAKKLGYEQVNSLQGGLKAWKEANLPVSKA
jgi:rhodanese-related sulfurtransferase